MGQGASRDKARRWFRERLGGWGTCSLGVNYLPSRPQAPILVGYLAQLAYVPLIQQPGGIGRCRQIVGALRPHGEQVKMPGRSS